MNATADPEIAATFIEQLFAPSDHVLFRPVESWTENGKKRSRVDYNGTFWPTINGNWRTLLGIIIGNSNETFTHTFFGVCPRFGGRKFDKAWQIRVVRVLWADLDNLKGDNVELRVTEAIERCRMAGLPHPSVIVSSGNGVHLYWQLVEPIVIDDVGDPLPIESEWLKIGEKNKRIEYFVNEVGDRVFLNDRATGKKIAHAEPPLSPKAQHVQDVLQGLSASIGGDSTHDLSRLLRVAGTLNRKDQRNGRSPTFCTVIENSGTTYSINDFDRFAEKSPARLQRELAAKMPLPVRRKLTPERVDKLNRQAVACDLASDRSKADFSLCCSQIESGISQDSVWEQVQNRSKFAERGREYFDRTWKRAEDTVRLTLLAQVQADQIVNGWSKVSSEVPPDEAGTNWTDIKTDQGRTELANARRFVASFGENVRYCHPWSKWLAWDGSRWKIDDDGAVQRMATTVADSVWHEVGGFHTDDAVEFAEKTSKASGINSMLKLAASMRPIRVDELDANPWILNCPNGTVDLRTGELRPHRREDCLTKLCPTNFNPDATTYVFDRFLDGVFSGNATLIDFLQRLFGYCLTGDVREQCLPVFHGSGANGKSTLLTAIQDALGIDYSTTAPPSLLMEKKTDSHPTELAGLFGKRLVVAQETTQGARLAESTVKQLTGGDRVSARRMREDFWEFNPTHKLILCTNHKPRVKGTDHAIWRRLLLIPFANKFWNPAKGESGPDELRQDKELPAKLKAEAEGILAWMVQGCLAWQRDGLQVPDIVRAATEVYRSESDTVGRFVEECCLKMPSVRVKFSDLYDALETWCRDGGDHPPSRTFVGLWLKEAGYQDKQSGARWYLGIALNAETAA